MGNPSLLYYVVLMQEACFFKGEKMKQVTFTSLFTTAAALCFLFPPAVFSADFQKTRLIIMADMGNEPDEEQQMTHMLMYNNMFDLEGLIACSGKYLHSGRNGYKSRTHPELFHQLIDAYEKVLPNLKKHASGWRTPDYLRSIVKSGTDEYGIEAVKAGQSNEASKLIEAALLKNDPRKLYIVGNAGTNTLAQALVDLDETRTKSEMDSLCRKIIVFENGAQDNSGGWITKHYPEIAWHRSNYQTYCYGGPGNKSDVEGPYVWQPHSRSTMGQHDWVEEHVQKNHGPLGDLFPDRFGGNGFMEGGGTIPWMGLVNHGLTDPERMYWGGWSGRFSRVKHKNVYSRHGPEKNDEKSYGDFYMYEADSEKEQWTDPVVGDTFNDFKVPVWRFRRAMWNDFRARMDWCVNEYDKANHNPVAVINGDASDTIMTLKVKPGTDVKLDASDTSDPDGDELIFKWWVYKEAGTYTGDVTVSDPAAASIEVKVSADADGKEFHVILEVLDENDEIGMYDYRRVVFDVSNDHTDK